MIEIRDISKRYGEVLALDNVSLKLHEGKIYGLLGRNGAGKSTLLNILTGRIFATDGDAFMDGERILENDAALGRIYLMSEKTLYPEGMRIKDAFKWSREFYPDFDIQYAEKLAGLFSLNMRKKVKSLSTGYNSIFKLIVGLSANTPYVFFDEPVLGLDANHRDLFYKLLVESYAENPRCIVISTHLIEEVSAIIEEVVIIKQGRIIRNENREELLRQGYSVSGPASAVDAFVEGREVLGQDVLGGLKSAYIMGQKPDSIPEGLETAPMDLQRLFIQLTNA